MFIMKPKIATLCTLLSMFLNMRQTVGNNNEAKYTEALASAQSTCLIFVSAFSSCLGTSMANPEFNDNLQKLVFEPARTTVGFGPKYKANRKFFGNMISSAAFKNMLAKDEEEVRLGTIRKIKYCDQAIMDHDFLKDFYEREVDQTKI